MAQENIKSNAPDLIPAESKQPSNAERLAQFCKDRKIWH